MPARAAKRDVIEALFLQCQKNNNSIFHNNDVKALCAQLGFGNPFDVTKIDNSEKLPQLLKDNDYCIIHLGSGRHQFFKGINIFYHTFEPIQNTIDWPYKKSLLNQYNSSESNMLSIANNQRILHHFLFGKDEEFAEKTIEYRPKTYFPHRTKTNLEYSLGKDKKLLLENIQIEIDLTIEQNGIVGIFEAKNGTPKDFSIYQLYYPYLYYHNAKENPELLLNIKEIIAIYLVHNNIGNSTTLKMWAYTFLNPYDITTMHFIKSCAYRLVQE